MSTRYLFVQEKVDEICGQAINLVQKLGPEKAQKVIDRMISSVAVGVAGEIQVAIENRLAAGLSELKRSKQVSGSLK